jgi:AcrR family transcriptional regulator
VTARGHRTREKLLRAAETVFGERGYDKSGIADIARTAGVALGTFYIYFPDKKAVFVELVDELGMRLRRELTDATDGLTTRLDIERAGLRAFFGFVARHRGLYRIVRQAEFVEEDAFRRYYTGLGRAYASRLAIAMDAGEIRSLDAECLAYCLMGMADFLGMRWVLWEDDSADLDGVVEQAMIFVAQGLALAASDTPKRAKSSAPRRTKKKGRR